MAKNKKNKKGYFANKWSASMRVSVVCEGLWLVNKLHCTVILDRAANHARLATINRWAQVNSFITKTI